jgi:hypothetical protein
MVDNLHGINKIELFNETCLVNFIEASLKAELSRMYKQIILLGGGSV